MQRRIFAVLSLVSLISFSSAVEKLIFNRVLDRPVDIRDNGEVGLTGPGIFFVTADLDFNADDNTVGSTANMMLALYSSKSMLSSDCLGMVPYDIAAHNATLTNSSWSLLLMNFKADGNFIDTSLWLDRQHWSLNANAIYADTCSSLKISYNDTDILGVIGLGFADGSSSNYLQGQPLFSIYINRSLQTGELLFKEDSSKKDGLDTITTLSSDNNWRVPNTNSILIGDITLPFNVTANYELNFDINSDAIGIPDDLYLTFINYIMLNTNQLRCSNSTYQPVCTYTGKLSDLPVLTFVFADASLPVPPEVYVANNQDLTGDIDGEITLYLKSVSVSQGGSNHVTSLYVDNFIMDAHVLSYYYTVFSGDVNQRTGNITLFKAVQTNTPNQPNQSYWWIWLLIILFMLIAFALYLYIAKKRKDNSLLRLDEAGLMMA